MLLGTCGFPGLGKTSIARILVRHGFLHISSDMYVRQMFRKVKFETPEEHDAVFGAMKATTAILLKQGHNIIFDSNMTLIAHREEMYKIAQEAGSSYRTLFLKGDLQLAKERNQQRLTPDKVGDEVIERMYEQLQPPEAAWENALTINAEQSLEEIEAHLIHELGL